MDATGVNSTIVPALVLLAVGGAVALYVVVQLRTGVAFGRRPRASSAGPTLSAIGST